MSLRLAALVLLLTGCSGGNDGAMGLPGSTGETGAAGEQGPRGEQGLNGAMGQAGEVGPPGPRGGSRWVDSTGAEVGGIVSAPLGSDSDFTRAQVAYLDADNVEWSLDPETCALSAFPLSPAPPALRSVYYGYESTDCTGDAFILNAFGRGIPPMLAFVNDIEVGVVRHRAARAPARTPNICSTRTTVGGSCERIGSAGGCAILGAVRLDETEIVAVPANPCTPPIVPIRD